MTNKILIVTICSFILLVTAAVTEAQQQSRFIQYNLKYGVSVQIPSHWRIIDKQVMDQIDTITELLTKAPQGDNDIIITAHYVVSNKLLATVRISVRTRNTFSQDTISNMSQAEIDKKDVLSRTMLVNALEQMNDTSTKISAFKTTKERLSGFICVRTDYQTIRPSETMDTSIYVIYLGNRAVKMTLSYENSHKDLLKMSVDKIKRSLVVSSVVTGKGIVTKQITPGEAKNAFNDYLTQIRNGNGSEAIDKYFDAMTYIKLSFSDYLSVMNRNELEALREEFINYMKKVMSMPAIRKLKHKILEERIITNGFAEVKYLDAYGTPLEMEHTIVFRKTEGRLLYFDMRREGQSMPKMLGKFYSQYSGELSPIAFIKTLNDSLSRGQ